MKKIRGWHIYLAITFILLGLLITLQLETQTRLSAELSHQSQSDLSVLVKNLSDKRVQLEQELEEAEATLATYQDDYNDDTTLINQLSNEVTRLQMNNGAIAIKGSGASIQITAPEGALLASDLVILTNELWAAGAEAISVNDIRITPGSGFGYLSAMDKTYLTCDGEILRAPIVFHVIGNGITIERSLTMPGGIADNLEIYQVILQIAQEDDLHLPASVHQSQFEYGKAPEKSPSGTP